MEFESSNGPLDKMEFKYKYYDKVKKMDYIYDKKCSKYIDDIDEYVNDEYEYVNDEYEYVNIPAPTIPPKEVALAAREAELAAREEELAAREAAMEKEKQEALKPSQFGRIATRELDLGEHDGNQSEG